MGLVAVKRFFRGLVRPSSRPAFLRRFRIAQRLVLCFGVTASLLVALGVFCLAQMQNIRDQGKAVESGSLPSIAMADAIAIDLIKLRGESARLIANAADIDRIARGETSEDIAAMNGWRYEMFGRKAQALLSGKLAVSFEGGQVRLFDV